MQEDLTRRHARPVDGADQHDAVVVRLGTVNQVEAKAEADRGQANPLQQTERAWKFVERELEDVGGDQNAADDERPDGVERARRNAEQQ